MNVLHASIGRTVARVGLATLLATAALQGFAQPISTESAATTAGVGRSEQVERHADASQSGGVHAPTTAVAPYRDAPVLLAAVPYDMMLFEPPSRTRPAMVAASPRGLALPEPAGWVAVPATIALALFFFVRRATWA